MAVIGLVAAVAAGSANPTEAAPAPDVVGQTSSKAKQILHSRWFGVEASNSEVSDKPEGTILSQSPEPGSQVQQGLEISVVTSAGQPPNPGDIFADDFSDKDFSNTFGGWDIGEYNCCVSEYLNGGYRMYSPPSANTDNTGLANEVGDIEDAILEVDATRIGDAPEEGDSYWGIGCRVQGDYSGYYMEIWDDGYAEIYKYEDDKHNDLVWGYFEDAIREGSATNHIRADCVGDELALYVNGKKLLEAEDAEFGSGKVGLYVGYTNDAPSGTSTEVLFDNFQVSTPP